MNFDSRSYTLLCILSILLCTGYSYSQGCEVIFPETSENTSRTRTARQAAQSTLGLKAWSNLENVQIQDEQFAFVELDAGEFSEILQAKNFNLRIPQGSTIHGISLEITGKSQNQKPVDAIVRLVGEQGNSINQTFVTSGTSWPTQNGSWRYGASWYDWGFNLNAEVLNDQGFGVEMQLSNLNSETSIAEIDEIGLKIYYQKPYSVCVDHSCIIASLGEVSGATSYEWDVPKEFQIISSEVDENVVVLAPVELITGVFELCVTPQGVISQTCCGYFALEDCGTGSIGDFVWLDANQNGIQDPGEMGVEGIQVLLFDESNVLIDQTTSDATGFYQFTEVLSGEYYIKVETDSKTILTAANSGAANLDSDILGILGDNTSDYFFLAPAENKSDIDIGVLKLVDISGTIWTDKNADGVRTSDETGFANLEVQLIDSNGNLVQTQTTNASGHYFFEDILQGTYSLQLVTSETYFISPFDQGTEDVDSDFQLDGSVQLNNIQTDQIIDGGIFEKGSIGDFIWLDLNRNGVLDGTENGMFANVVVFDDNGILVNSMQTNQGSYSFDQLIPGSYLLTIVVDEEFEQSLVTAQNMPLTYNGLTYMFSFNIESGEQRDDLDFGFQYKPSTINGFAWLDNNGDGLSSNEQRLENVEVQIFDENNQLVQSVLSDSNGNYQFDNLNPGSYYVVFDVPAALNFTTSGGESSVDNSITFGSTAWISVAADEEINNINAGYFEFSELGNYVWLDLNRNGIQDSNEEGIAELEIQLSNQQTNNTITTATNADGLYTFVQVEPGEYVISIENESDFLATLPNQGNGSNDSRPLTLGPVYYASENFVVASGSTLMNLDFGFQYKPSSISGIAWLDNDADGVFENEEIIPEIEVSLFSSNGTLLGNTMTINDGTYTFENLNPGQYYVSFSIANNMQFSPSGLDSDVTGSILTGSTDLISLNANQDITSIDAGYYSFAEVGDYVWIDANENGIQDATENGLAGQTVVLVNVQNGEQLVTQTMADGFYSFEQIVPGDYRMELVQNELYLPTNAGLGNGQNDSRSLMLLGNQYVSLSFPLSSGEVKTDVDFGFILQTGTINGNVWEDKNADGSYVSSEAWKNNVAVSLFNINGGLVQSTTTNASGAYSFDDVISGDYYVQFELGSNEAFSPFGISSDVSGANGPGTTSDLMLQPGETLNASAGIYILASIGDYIWLDENEDGIQNASESGIGGMKLTLNSLSSGAQVSTTTDNSGNYSFTNLIPGNYLLTIDKDVNLTPAAANIGNGNNDSRPLTDVGIFYAGTNFEVCSGEHISNQDFGFVMLTGSISGAAWLDYNADGNIDANEPFEQGVTVILFDEMSNQMASQTTDSNGNYTFENVPPGMYYIVFDQLADLNFSSNGSDSDITNAFVDGSTDLITVDPSENVLGIDGGYFGFSSIAGFIWLDENQDGIQGSDENGIGGISVNLFDSAMNPAGLTTSDAGGNYEFGDLLPGEYYVVFNMPTTLINTIPNAGNGQNDSDVVGTFGVGSTGIISLGFLENQNEIDAGYIESMGIVQGTVFIDGDANGLNEAMDIGYPDVQVSLFTATGLLLDVASTNMSGQYSFEGYPAGDYYVQFGVPNGFNITEANVGNDDTIDSDVTGDNGVGTTQNISLTSQGIVSNVDLGIYEFVAIGDMVWIDENQNGLMDSDEVGLEGVSVTLVDIDGNLLNTDQTDENGKYLLNNILPGTYQLKFDLPEGFEFTAANVGTDEALDSDVTDASGFTGFTDLFMIVSGMASSSIDAGVIQATNSEISGLAWLDNNGNGLQEAGETFIAGIQVNLFDDQGTLVEQTTTMADGGYSFTSVNAGVYYIVFDHEADFVSTESNVGLDDAIDSDVTANVVGFSTDYFAVNDGDVLSDINSGVYQYATIGNRVWFDENENGIQDSNEFGIDGVLVELRDQDGVLVGSATTEGVNGASGIYQFENIVPGIYVVSFTLDNDLGFTERNVGSDSTLDSDVLVNGTGNSVTAPFSVVSGELNNDLDAGAIELENFVVTGFVFEDFNFNGIKDLNDTYLNGVVVNIYDEDGVFIDTRTTMTDGNGVKGRYIFDNILMDNYYVEFILPSGAQITLADQGTNDGLDSDVTGANGVNTTDVFAPNTGMAANLICAGFYYFAQVGDYLWLDNNNDGIQNAEENGRNNRIVDLFTADGVLFTQVLTGPGPNGTSGYYQINDIPPGDYYLKFNINGSDFTVANAGFDDAADSDVTQVNGPGTTAVFAIESGEIRDDLDAGIEIEPGEVGDRVWIDLNGNGVQDTGEPGLENVLIELYDETDELINTMFSDAQGKYFFKNVAPGNYYLVFNAPAGYIVSDPDQGGDDTKDSDIMGVIANGATNIFNLNSGEIDPDMDAGFFLPSRIGDFVWDDLNQNGIQDAGEPGVEGVSVDLKIGPVFVLQTTVTDENGYYEFSNINQGPYSLEFYDLPDGYQFSPMDQGGNDALDSDASPTTGQTSVIALAYNVDFMDMDAGIFKTTNLASTGNGVDVHLFPNPTTDYLTHTLDVKAENQLTWKIINAFGQVIKESNFGKLKKGRNKMVTNVSDLPPGLYHIRYEFDRFYKMKSFIVE